MQTRTRRQRDVLEFITRYIENHGYEPSYQVIARHLGVSSKAGIAKHVKALESQGLLTRRDCNGKFSLEVVRDLPEISNGVRIEWLETADDAEWPDNWSTSSFSLPDFLLGNFGGDRLFAFRVPDDAMAEKSICTGDIVLIEPRSFVRDGDTIVARIRNAAPLLRTYFRNGSKVELRPADGSEASMIYSADKVDVVGVYRGLLRPLR
jgi:repressor LexA